MEDIEQRLNNFENHELERRTGEITAGRSAAKTTKASDRAEKAMAEAREVAEQVRSQPTAPPTAAPPGIAPQMGARQLMPEELRLAMFGNLGWNTGAADLETGTVEVLTAAHIAPASYAWVAACVGRSNSGSVCQVLSHEQTTIWRACRAIRNLQKEYEATRQVWCDRQKSPEELKPARMLHRMCEIATDLEKAKRLPQQLDKVMSTKVLKCDGSRVAFILNGELQFTVLGLAKWSQEQRGLLAAAASDV